MVPEQIVWPIPLKDLLATMGWTDSTFQTTDGTPKINLNQQYINTEDEINLATNFEIYARFDKCTKQQKEAVFRAFLKLFVFNVTYNQQFLQGSFSTSQGNISQAQEFTAKRSALLLEVFDFLKFAGFLNPNVIVNPTPGLTNSAEDSTYRRALNNLIPVSIQGHTNTPLTFYDAIRYFVYASKDTYTSSDKSVEITPGKKRQHGDGDDGLQS